jgi:hypothetical protein
MTAASTPIATAGHNEATSAHHQSDARSVLMRVLGAAFLLAIFIPLAGTFFHWDMGSANNENRRLAEIPGIPKTGKELSHYSDHWLDYYRDHFGFRNAMIHTVAESRALGIGDALNGNVIVGKDGWLFLRPDGDHDLIAFRGLNPLSESELDAWQNLLEKRQAFLNSLGIPFLVVIPPDKQTIYPEYLPDAYKVVRNESRLDQLLNRLKATHSSVQIVDLRPALLAAKGPERLYHKTDTHWNDFGAFVGYTQIIQRAQQLLPNSHIVPQTRDDFVISPPSKEVGDLARMMDTPDEFPEEGQSWLRKKPFRIPPTLADRNKIAYMDNADPARPNLMIYRDSFSIALVPMLGPNFNRVVWAFQYELDPNTIRQEKPNLVIDEFLERNLYIAPPTDPTEIRDLKVH